MKLRTCALGAFLLLVLGASGASAGERMKTWYALSANAIAVTNNIDLSESKLSIGFVYYTLNRNHDLKPTEASAVFDIDPAEPGSGALYRTFIPAGTRFQRNNTLCGGEDVQWMAKWATAQELKVAFFSSSEPPVLTFDAVSRSQDLCGVYTYKR